MTVGLFDGPLMRMDGCNTSNKTQLDVPGANGQHSAKLPSTIPKASKTAAALEGSFILEAMSDAEVTSVPKS